MDKYKLAFFCKLFDNVTYLLKIEIEIMINKNTKLWHIDAINIFKNLSYGEKQQLQEEFETLNYSKKEVIHKSGDTLNKVCFVVSGQVKIVNHSSNKKECIKRIVNEGDVFGEISSLNASSNLAFTDGVKSMKNNTTILTVSVEYFNAFCAENTKIQELVIKNVLMNFKRIDQRLESIMFYNSKDRLIYFIKELAADFGKDVGHEKLIKHNMTHQEIANLTAISRQKVTTILNELKKDGTIHLERNSMLVHDMDLLK